MFEDVAEMEREIDTFRKNVVASSELVEGISRLTAETKQQKESFSASAEELLKKLDDCIVQFKSDHESALRTMGESNESMIATHQKNLTAEQQAILSDLEKTRAEMQKYLADSSAQADTQIRALSATSDKFADSIREEAEKNQAQSLEQRKQFNADCDRVIAETKSVLETQQKAFAESLQQTENVIKGYQADAESKYAEFINCLETTNVDQIFKEVQDLKKTIQTKFAILIGGVGLTLLAVILSLFIK